MKDKLNNALNEINDKFIEEAANADRLEKSPVKVIKYIAGGAAAVAAVAAVCVGLNHFGFFGRGVDLVDSLPSTSQDSPSSSDISENTLSDSYQYAFEYYWEESMPLVSVTQDYADSLIFGSEFPYMLYANNNKAVFTDGVGGIYVYSFTENKLTLAADINKNVEFIKDNCPFEFFNIDPNSSSPAPTVNFKCGVDGEIICSVTYYAEVPSTMGHTDTEYKAYEQYYRISEEYMTLELFDSFPLTDYALYSGLRDITETDIEGAISHNVAMIEGSDQCVYLSLNNTNEDMLYNIRLHERDINDDKYELAFMPFDGYLAKTIYLGDTYRSMMSTITSNSNAKIPVLTFNDDGTFTLTHIFGDDTMVSGNYMVQGDVVRLISYPLSSPMQQEGDPPYQKGTVWYLRFDESNALWADENSFAATVGYAMAGDKVLFLKQSTTVRYANMAKTIKAGDEYHTFAAILALEDTGRFAFALDSSDTTVDFSGTYTETDTTITLNDVNGAVYTFTKDGITLNPDEEFIKGLESNPDHYACIAFLQSPTLYNTEEAEDLTNGDVVCDSQIKQVVIAGKTFNYRLRLELLADGTALLYVAPAYHYDFEEVNLSAEECYISRDILVDEGTHKIENGKFILTMTGQESTLTLSIDHPSLYENVMANLANNFDPRMNNPYSEGVYNKLAEEIAKNTPLEIPETGNGRAAFCDKVSMANEPSEILNHFDGYVVRSTSDKLSTIVDKDNVAQQKNLFFADSEALMDVIAEGEYYVVSSTIGDYETDGSQLKKYYIHPETRLIERIDIYDCINSEFVLNRSYEITFILSDDGTTKEQIIEEIEAQQAEKEWFDEKIDDLSQDIEMLQAEKELLDEKTESLNKKIEALKSAKENTDTLNDKLAALQAEKDALAEYAENIKQKLETLQTEIEDHDEYSKTFDEKLKTLQAEIETLTEESFADTDRELMNEFVAKIAENHTGEITPPEEWVFPTESEYITTYYGYDSWRGGVHDGIDIAEEGGKPILAVADGTAYVGSNDNSWFGGYGNTVAVLHDGGYITVYSCAYEILVEDGERVTAGQTIATVGTTGASTGNHLHFEMRDGTDAINPFNIVYSSTDRIDNILLSALSGFEPTLPESLIHPLPAEYTEISEGMGENGYIGHTGIDFAVPMGTEVYAADDGEVIYADWLSAYGNCVIIKHDNGCFTVYAHLSQLQTAKGEKRSAGDLIGLSGSTGMSTGNHLHFELRRGTSPVDPTSLLGL